MKDTEIKCVVWDLDNTLWDGILLESNDVKLKPGIKEIIHTLDSRGILHSIASKNSYDHAMAKIKEFKLERYFLYPEIVWDAKSISLKRIQKNLNISMNSLMLIDDQPFERDEVKHVYPVVFCVDASEYKKLPDYPRLNPRFITDDSRRRRQMYLENIKRKREEDEYNGPKAEFLASLNIKLNISEAQIEDLKRAEELTIRTNQLNTTGKTYDYDALKRYLNSDKHKLLICEMTDKYGDYGKIGLALVETNEVYWNLRLLLMSCRVITYGIGTVFLSYIMHKAKRASKKMLADFRKTGKNRMMYITFKFLNFSEIDSNDSGEIVLKNDLTMIQDFPSYIDVNTV